MNRISADDLRRLTPHGDSSLLTGLAPLLVEILPLLASEPGFALKGGTAINLFEHDLPRLSVDIDPAWLPVNDYAEDAKLMAEALERLADALRARPLKLQVQTS